MRTSFFSSVLTALIVGSFSATAAAAQALTLSQFLNCISASGSGGTCQLAAGTYVVDGQTLPTITINRSGITVQGTVVSGVDDTTIQRGFTTDQSCFNSGQCYSTMATGVYAPTSLITLGSGVSNVTIQDFTVDGNRYYDNGTVINCENGDQWFHDVWVPPSNSSVNVTNVNFINAPQDAVLLEGQNSAVTSSSFGMGTGPNGYKTSTRSTAIFVTQSNNGAWYNTIYYSGSAGITLFGSTQYAYGNTLVENRFEQGSGGQVFTNPSSSYASITANVVNGNYFSVAGGSLQNGCVVPGTQMVYPSGIESYGSYQRFFDNEVANNTGTGIQLGGSSPMTDIEVSSSNPWNSSDILRYIENNGYRGIWFLGPSEGWPYSTSGVLLDDVAVRNNSDWGLYLDGVSGQSGYEGFTADSCISGNTAGSISEPGSSLQNPYPQNYDTCKTE